jgi:hypothetical protein
LLVSIAMLAGAAALSIIVLWIINPNLWNELDTYGQQFDTVSGWLGMAFVAVFGAAILWLRRPRTANGRGFDTMPPS